MTGRLTVRLAARDLRRRTAETLLLLAALAVAAASLTVALLLHGQTAAPYAETRAATAGPDVVGTLFPRPRTALTRSQVATLARVARQPGVVASTGPLPVVWTALHTHGLRAVAEVEGRTARRSAVDRPHLVSGTWVRPGGAVVERAFARALGAHAGDTVDLGGRRVEVVGVAVSAALPSYPQLCTIGCILDEPGWHAAQPGLVWLPRRETRALATHREPLVYLSYLRLKAPGDAPAFARRNGGGPTAALPATYLVPWQEVARRHAELLSNERAIAVLGSSLLVVLGLATVVVLVGGRMADEVRRVGLLKAVGATPWYVVRLLLASYLAVGVSAAAVGLTAGRMLAPLLVSPGAGLLGGSGPTTLTLGDMLTVLGTIVAVVLVSTTVSAWRAARTNTVRALADSGRRPRRLAVLIGVSAALPAPVLVGIRMAARRPRRALLTACSIAVAACGSVVVLFAQAGLRADGGSPGGPPDPNAAQLHSVMLTLTLLLATMAALNLLFVTRAAVTDSRGQLATVRALGASPNQAAIGLAVAQLAPALVGLLGGMGAGVLLFRALSTSGHPAPGWASMVALAAGIVALAVALTAIPTRVESRRPVAALLRSS